MEKKYRLLENDTILRDGRKLYRIEALRNIRSDVRRGSQGGYVESEANLSHEGRCWVYDNACAYEDARVEGDALLYEKATLRGKAKLIEKATLWATVIVQGEAIIGGESVLGDQVVVGGRAILKGHVSLIKKVHVSGNAYLEGDDPRELVIQGTTMIHGNTIIQGYGFFPEKDAILETGSFRLGEDDETTKKGGLSR